MICHSSVQIISTNGMLGKFQLIPDTKYDLMHKYDHYIKHLEKCYSYTLFSVMIFILLLYVNLSVEFFLIFQNQSAAGNVIQQIKKNSPNGNFNLILFFSQI